MGRCLFGIGSGHAADVLILSRLRFGVRGCGEEDRVCPAGIGRGRAIVAIFCNSATAEVTSANVAISSSERHVRSCRARDAYPKGGNVWRNAADSNQRI